VSAIDPLFEADWVHVFEEDGPEGAVYRPEGDDLKRSRRPRQRISFARNGSARLVVAGPDDRLREVEVLWREEGGEITISTGSEGGLPGDLRVRFRSKGELLVRR
jgi:hypothetical protein